jgi:hypothetical protein
MSQSSKFSHNQAAQLLLAVKKIDQAALQALSGKIDFDVDVPNMDSGTLFEKALLQQLASPEATAEKLAGIVQEYLLSRSFDYLLTQLNLSNCEQSCQEVAAALHHMSIHFGEYTDVQQRAIRVQFQQFSSQFNNSYSLGTNRAKIINPALAELKAKLPSNVL